MAIPDEAPELFLEMQAASTGPASRVALLLPTTACVRDCEAYRGARIVIGAGTPGTVSPVSALRDLERSGTPTLVLVHSDQLVMPGVANVLVRLDHVETYISGIEYLLCSKHGYRLGAWTRAGARYLEPGASIGDVARLVVDHLQDCTTLGERWLASGIQVQRLAAHRKLHRERMLRFVQSSIAYAVADAARDAPAIELLAYARVVQSLAETGARP
jgi:hypothetical protein